MTVSEIKKIMADADPAQWAMLVDKYMCDERTSVQKMAQGLQKKIDLHERRVEKLNRMTTFDREMFAFEGAVAGVDEAGRGPLAGPVVAAACVIEWHIDLLGVDDSKKLSEEERERLFELIKTHAVSYGVGIVDAATIDEINILEATKVAMYQSIHQLGDSYQAVITDHVKLDAITEPLAPVVKGDEKSLAVAAASILAKVTRDRMMKEYDLQYPGYDFSVHKGYGTKMHYRALEALGPSPIHRMTFLRNMEW